MAIVTGLTAERMIEMENATIISGYIVGDDLMLLTRDGTPINAGNVRGLQGIPGASFILCTSASRPSLGASDAGKAIYETDTKLIRLWIGTRWRLQEKIVCTSATRPTGLVSQDEGVKIYETDTNLEFTWTGTAWLLANSYVATFANAAARTAAWPSPPAGALSVLLDAPQHLWLYHDGGWYSGAALGRVTTVGTTTPAQNGSGDSPVDVPGMAATWTAVPGRVYKLSVRAHTYSSIVGDLGWWQMTDENNVEKFAANTLAQSTTLAKLFEFSYEESALSGVVTRKLRFYPPVAGGILTMFADSRRRARLLVEDIGM